MDSGEKVLGKVLFASHGRYYMFELGFYVSLVVTSLIYDVRRKDFLEMQVCSRWLEMCCVSQHWRFADAWRGVPPPVQIHHWATIIVMSLSYSANFSLVGAMVMSVFPLPYVGALCIVTHQVFVRFNCFEVSLFHRLSRSRLLLSCHLFTRCVICLLPRRLY